MKNRRAVILILAFTIVSVTGIYAFIPFHTYEASGTGNSVSITDSTDTKTYTCPMHPEVISDKTGECPKCGMDLILKEGETNKDGKKDDKKDESMKHKNCKGCMHKH